MGAAAGRRSVCAVGGETAASAGGFGGGCSKGAVCRPTHPHSSPHPTPPHPTPPPHPHPNPPHRTCRSAGRPWWAGPSGSRGSPGRARLRRTSRCAAQREQNTAQQVGAREEPSATKYTDPEATCFNSPTHSQAHAHTPTHRRQSCPAGACSAGRSMAGAGGWRARCWRTRRRSAPSPRGPCPPGC